MSAGERGTKRQEASGGGGCVRSEEQGIPSKKAQPAYMLDGRKADGGLICGNEGRKLDDAP